MEKKKEPVTDVVISGEDAAFIRDLLGSLTDSQTISKTLDELFSMALFGQAHYGGKDGISPNSAFSEFHWHYAYVMDLKKLASTIEKYID